jgi:hypothetical protein
MQSSQSAAIEVDATPEQYLDLQKRNIEGSENAEEGAQELESASDEEGCAGKCSLCISIGINIHARIIALV